MMVEHGMKLKKIHFNLRTMKDKEKAEEIALKYAREYLVSKNDSHKQNTLFKESSIIECEKASLEMAEWKDEQLHKELFKLSLSSNLYDYMMWVCNKTKELEEQLKNNSNGKTT